MNIKKKSKGTPEQMLQAFENKINELEGNASIEGAADISNEFSSNYIDRLIEHVCDKCAEEYNASVTGELVGDWIEFRAWEGESENELICTFEQPLDDIDTTNEDAMIDYCSSITHDFMEFAGIESMYSSIDITAADEVNDADYLEELCNYVTANLDDAGYEAVARVEGEYIVIESMYDVDSRYVQPIDDIEPNWDDLNEDAAELADAYMDKYPDPDYGSGDDEDNEGIEDADSESSSEYYDESEVEY